MGGAYPRFRANASRLSHAELDVLPSSMRSPSDLGQEYGAEE